MTPVVSREGRLCLLAAMAAQWSDRYASEVLVVFNVNDMRPENKKLINKAKPSYPTWMGDRKIEPHCISVCADGR